MATREMVIAKVRVRLVGTPADDAYESEQFPVPEVRGIAMVRHLMEARDLQQEDVVPLFGGASVAAATLRGERPLTLAQIARLSAYFALPVDLFIDRAARDEDHLRGEAGE